MTQWVFLFTGHSFVTQELRTFLLGTVLWSRGSLSLKVQVTIRRLMNIPIRSTNYKLINC
jgi:hypothetical protein